MHDELLRRVARLAADAQSGASGLLPVALDLLEQARAAGPSTLHEAARAVGLAQPSMASFWNAVAAALSSDAARLPAFRRRVERSRSAMVRVALQTLGGRRPFLAVTHSASGSVLAVLAALADRDGLHVTCSEGRPHMEGRQTAGMLADAGAEVQLCTDAALTGTLGEADAVLIGADAIAPSWFVNKTGTAGLAAAATLLNVPVYLVASRDKFLPAPLVECIRIEDRDPGEVWEAPPSGVTVRNRYFEQVPLDWVTVMITDAGPIGPDDADEVCRANGGGIDAEVWERMGTWRLESR